jgi:hypothetical protein
MVRAVLNAGRHGSRQVVASHCDSLRLVALRRDALRPVATRRAKTRTAAARCDPARHAMTPNVRGARPCTYIL